MEVTGDLHRVFWVRGGESQTAGAGQGVVGEEVKSPSADRLSEKCGSLPGCALEGCGLRRLAL